MIEIKVDSFHNGDVAMAIGVHMETCGTVDYFDVRAALYAYERFYGE